ncbi:mannose/fructose/sorbose PTS transporter subunit IIA [Clostridium estertheticum]|uniref:PTS sugar transporter subunit IIA n=1 Tax=Clostridium estertheticum TaxID=238834 RepID=UPI001C0DA9A7|nr:mannose/fructose/sorbose PTS transporter subunit IIA [Clostridium estertheticum]MBU3200448.1 mannose/fructose/sorbose PTS transporter subunit IIA [Clostridium estertheticum]WAG67276.1 mannose/fructose/sorbose PTS transporter subunit IIA [Clostridium estertheticum]
MIAIILGSHGKFSKELLKSSEMILGKQENIGYVTLEPGESADDLVKKYEDLIKNLDIKEGLLFMVDLFGGSPFNAASRIAITSENIDIVTGVNLPMLLEVSVSRDFKSLDDIVRTAIDSGLDAIKSFKANFNDNDEEELE